MELYFKDFRGRRDMLDSDLAYRLWYEHEARARRLDHLYIPPSARTTRPRRGVFGLGRRSV